MKYPRISFPLLVIAFALCATASATEILNVTTALTSADPTQQGRLFRNGIPQDWAGTRSFPGVMNLTTTYHYHTFVIDPLTVALGPFIQISIDDVNTRLFASAYSTSYLPNSGGAPNFGFDTNWLGDAGASGNLPGGVPGFFQVTVPVGASLVVVVNDVTIPGLLDPFNLLVESFSDTEFSPAAPGSTIPDGGPSLVLTALVLGGLCLIAGVRRYQFATR
jgi:hypothetical protein